MAPKTTWVPGTVASDAVHVFIAVGALLGRARLAPGHLTIGTHLNGLGDMAARVVRIALRVDRFGRLRHDPLKSLLDVAALDQDRLATRNSADLEPRLAKSGAQSQQIRRLIPRGRPTGR